MKSRDDAMGRLTICETATQEEAAYIRHKLDAYNQENTHGRMGFPDLDLELAMMAPDGTIVGGIQVSSVLGVMFLEVLWVAEAYRRRGLARRLVWEAERIAERRGCVAAGTWTFSFQGPDFYPRAGYKLIGIYDGYPFGITEHVLMKTLPDKARPNGDAGESGFVIVASPSREQMKTVYDGFHRSCVASVGDEMHNPGISIALVLRAEDGTAVGGLLAGTTIRIMALEQLWVDACHRGKGYGRELVRRAEEMAKEYGCVAVQGTCFSFQSAGFFPHIGYERFGVAEVYLDGFTEDYLIKTFK